MEQSQLDLWASALNEARIKAHPIQQLSQLLKSEGATFTRADAYSMQERQFEARKAAGEIQVGWKMGLTSEAKRKQMNLDSPLYGFLTDKMQLKNHDTFDLKGQIHPKIEPEIAFWIAADLEGDVTDEQVLASCRAVCACLEILDSRYEQFKYFSMEDVIADNSSSSHFVLGPWLEEYRDLDLSNLRMSMRKNGEVAEEGNSQDISGDPVMSVVELCKLLSSRGQKLKAGSIVLAGAATPAIALEPGMKVDLIVEGLRPVSVEIAK